MEDDVKKSLLFIQDLNKENLDKEKLFSGLYSVIGKDADLKKMHLPNSENTAPLRSNLIKAKLKMHQPKISCYLNKIKATEKKSQKKDLMAKVKFLLPEKNEYATLALDKYLKLDKKHTVDGFYKDYDEFRHKEQQKEAAKVRTNSLSPQVLKQEASRA